MSEEEKTGVENNAEIGVVIESSIDTEVVAAGRQDIVLQKLVLRTNLVNLITISRWNHAENTDKLYEIRKIQDGYYNIVFNDKDISSHHCAIYKRDGGYYLYDGVWYLKDGIFSLSNVSADGKLLEPFQKKPSKNGTYHSGGTFGDIRRLDTGEKKKLKTGDKITACRYAFEIEIR